MTAQNFETLRACVQALDELPDLIKPFTVEGTKLRLPKDIADKLDHIDALRKFSRRCTTKACTTTIRTRKTNRPLPRRARAKPV